MRISILLTAPLLAALAVSPSASATAQASVTVAFGARLGPEVRVFAYSPERLGDWQANFRRWTPTTLYDVNGHYYRTNVRGARAVTVYRFDDQYFLPPQDRAWDGFDKRYDYHRRPTHDDYDRAHPYVAPVVLDTHLGAEVGVFAYSRDRAGDWRANMRRWTPVTIYEANGRFFEHSGAGARPVSAYRYQNETFLPPTDDGWVGADKRFDYAHVPTHDDYARVRIHP